MPASPWSPLVTKLLAVFIFLDLAVLGLYHLMVYKVNKVLSYSDRIPHSLHWGGWKRLGKLYKTSYPRSSLYLVTLVLATCCLTVAIVAAGILWWQYLTAK